MTVPRSLHSSATVTVFSFVFKSADKCGQLCYSLYHTSIATSTDVNIVIIARNNEARKMLYTGYKNEDNKKYQKVSKSSPRNMNNTLKILK